MNRCAEKTNRTAVIFNANTPQIARANVLLESLRDHNKGNFKGDVWVISTALSIEAKRFLETNNCFYLTNPMRYLDHWEHRNEVAKSFAFYKVLQEEQVYSNMTEQEKIDLAFVSFRNRYLSKLVYLDWVKKVGERYDKVLLCDYDVLIQKDLSALLEKYTDNTDEIVYVQQEENPVLPGTVMWEHNYEYLKANSSARVAFDKCNVGTGFLVGTPKALQVLFECMAFELKNIESGLIIDFGWNDQDILRLIRAKNPERFMIMDRNDAVHAQNGGESLLEERENGCYYIRNTDIMPTMIHFGGITKYRYESFKEIFQVDPNEYYSMVQKQRDETNDRRFTVTSSFGQLERDDKPIVSVIMPVHNSETYLTQSIDSVLSQSLVNLELICVINGSTDRSKDILEFYSEIDKRLIVLHQSDANQRAARNQGITYATGKYIYLIDSDDCLEANALEMLVEKAEQYDADLIYFFFKEMRRCFQDNDPIPRWRAYRRFFPSDVFFELKDEYKKFFIQFPFPWAKLMRRDFVLENHLFFDLDCPNFDDNPHNLRTLFAAKRPFVYQETFYHFRIHENSMTQKTNPRIIGMIDAIRLMNKIYIEKESYQNYVKWYVPYKVHLVSWAWDFLPDNMRMDYYYSVPALFYEIDFEYFENDETWSYFEIPTVGEIERVKGMLSMEYKDFINSSLS